MIVTDIIEYTKAKYKIYVDGEFAFVLYKGELRQFNIEKDKTISEEIYEEIESNVLLKRAKLRAMHLLEKRPYTERNLREKLKASFYKDEIIDLVIDYLKGFRYIDDYAYALQYIDTYSDTKSAKKIELDLKQKGINVDIIQQAIDQRKEEGEMGNEREMIRRLLDKKHYSEESADIKEKNRLMNYLFNKGFSIDNIRREMNNFE